MKSVLFWLIFLPLLYTLGGFVILPWWIRTGLPSLLQEKTGLHISIEQARFNPFTFELDLKTVRLLDEHAQKAAGIERLYLNYEPHALFTKEFLIQNVLLDQPFVDLSLDESGALKLLKLFPKTTDSNESSASQASLTMPLVIEHIQVQSATTHFADIRGSSPFQLDIGPISYSADNLSFYKDDLSIHAIKAMLQNEERLTIASSLSIEPLKFYGELNLKRLPLPSLWGYLLPTIPAKLAQGDLTLRVPFWIDLSKKVPSVVVEKGSALLENVQFIDTDQHAFITVPSLKAEAIDFDLNASRINIDTLALTKPDMTLALEKNYVTNFQRLFMPSSPTTPQTQKQTASPAWTFALNHLVVEGSQLSIVDQNVKAPPILLSPLAFSLKDITNDSRKSIAFDLNATLDKISSLALKGTFLPASNALDATIRADAISLEKAQPYIEPFTTVLIHDGSLTLQSKLQLSFDKTLALHAEGDVSVLKFSLADRFKQPLVAWETLHVKNASYTLSPASLRLQNVVLDKPYINLDIKKDGTTNFIGLLKTKPVEKSAKASKKTPQKKAAKAEESMALYIGDVIFKRGTAHFQDASLLLPFATFADRLNGSISTLDTKSTKPSVLKLEGKVDKYGYAKISGSVLPLDFKNRANLNILFKNINMSKLTPYSGKFVGYAIKEGKLSMDLKYQIKKGMMEGQNKINLDSLTLGEKIESKDAVNLPLELAIALLKDSNNQIDIDLPVSGNLNDPEFRYGSIVWKAVGNLLTGIVTSPFKLLGSLLGIEAEQLKSVDFAAGESVLIDSEEEKMVQYQQILEKRSGLKLVVTPSFNEALDMQALKENNITAQIEQLLPKKSKEDAYAKTVKKLFVQKYNGDEYDTLMKTFKEEQLDLAAINDRLIEKIAQTVTIPPEKLQELAQKRADTIIETLVKKHNVDPARLIKKEPQNVDPIRETWVGCIINISN
jgi:uncharacterized protein involved in outer membrane biogenesis